MTRIRQVVMLDPDVHRMLHEVCRTRSLSDWVQDAIVNRLKSWEEPAAFIAAKRDKLERTAQRPWPDELADALGYPRCVRVIEPTAEISRAMAAGGERAVRELMQGWWQHDDTLAGLGYSDACLAATLREWEKRCARKVKRAAAKPQESAVA